MTKQEFETCVEEYSKDIYSFCKHLTCSLQEAEDLYQNTFLKALELNDKIDFRHNPKSYLLSITIRIWKNQKRKFAWRKRITDMHPLTDASLEQTSNPKEPSLEEIILKEEEKSLVRTAVSHLPERLKLPTLLYYMETLSVTQISELLHIPAGTVKSRLYQARKQLEKELEVVLDEKHR